MSILDFSIKDDIDKKYVAWEGGSFHIVSLLDILRVYAAHFIQVSNLLADLRGIIKTLDFSGKTAAKFNPEMLNDYLTKMDWLLNVLSEMQLKMSLVTAEKIKKRIEESQRPDKELSNLISVLNGRIFDELNARLFFIISPEEAKLYNPEGTIFGREIADKFPNMVEDIVEAGNCFACNRYTACVFHLMRIMESTVQQFGKKLKIKIIPKDETWHKILQHVNKAITALPERTLKEKNRKDTYVATSVHLDNIRRVWRNDVMHPKATYTQEEVEYILGSVEIFIKDFAKIL